MPHQVCNAAQLTCTMGSALSALVVLPTHRLMTSHQPAANVTDYADAVHPEHAGAVAAWCDRADAGPSARA